jgi:uncharacterized protein
MREMSLLRILLLTAGIFIWHGAAQAQTSPTPRQLQAMIANGQENTALADLQPVLQAHPDSGVAWYLTAEAQDAAGNEAAARTAFANAEQYAPGLPFAQPNAVAALRAHLAAAAPAPQRHAGISPTMIVIGVLVLLFILLRGFFRRRGFMPPQGGYGGGYPGPQGPFGNSPGGMPYGQNQPGYPTGSGIGSSIVTGLAAGAGFAAGERIIDGLDGNRGDPQYDPQQSFGTPDRDDGLSGSPGWNDNSGDDDNQRNDGFDPGNDW